MKKAILTYCLLIYLFTFVMMLLSLNKVRADYVGLCLVCGVAIVALYNAWRNKNIKLSLSMLVLIHFFQSVGFFIGGLFYKFIIGPVLCFSILKTPDIITKIGFLLFDGDIRLVSANNQGFLLSFNIIHLALFIYFTKWLLKVERENKA